MPKQLTILSGKGGTGKTTVAASFFHMADSAVAADCDVDAPNLHLVLQPREIESGSFMGSSAAFIDSEKCSRCGICEEECPFGAIRDCEVLPLYCEGCGVCELVCPEGAAKLKAVVTGHTYVSETPCGILVHALLKPGSEATGKLVTEVRKKAVEIAEEKSLDIVIIDGSPGIGCPVIASISGADFVLAVTEPTKSGFWGFERICGVAKHFGVEIAACINKSDINPGIADEMKEYARREGVQILGEIPFDDEVNHATMGGKVLTEFYDGPASREIRELWKETRLLLMTEAKR
ncbi:MAG: 4Fe-4S binding protein [Actinobacteria bacterium]|nr:4Fe-4S binding protein [Actinomycetota bacterium]